MNHSATLPLLLTFLLAALDTSPAAAEGTYQVETVRDIPYRDLVAGEDAAAGKNKLDLYLPKGKKDFPVLFFVHGGAWRHGDKQFLGVYSALGRFWAKNGVGTVVINYRLSPAYQHPAHIQDVAKAFAWTQRNIGQHGGRPDQIFLFGHSAGGHLISLLATDESWLKAEGLSLKNIRGVMPLSGVYDINGLSPGMFTAAFGTDLEKRQKASPLTHVTANHPPFLIMYADGDFPTCDRTSERFCEVLRTCQCQARTLEIKQTNHATVLLKTCVAGDPVVKTIREFMEALLD